MKHYNAHSGKLLVDVRMQTWWRERRFWSVVEALSVFILNLLGFGWMRSGRTTGGGKENAMRKVEEVQYVCLSFIRWRVTWRGFFVGESSWHSSAKKGTEVSDCPNQKARQKSSAAKDTNFISKICSLSFCCLPYHPTCSHPFRGHTCTRKSILLFPCFILFQFQKEEWFCQDCSSLPSSLRRRLAFLQFPWPPRLDPSRLSQQRLVGKAIWNELNSRFFRMDASKRRW